MTFGRRQALRSSVSKATSSKRLPKKNFQRLRLALISPFHESRPRIAASAPAGHTMTSKKMQILFDFRLAYLTHTENSCVCWFYREARINCVYIFIAHHRFLPFYLSMTSVPALVCTRRRRRRDPSYWSVLHDQTVCHFG